MPEHSSQASTNLKGMLLPFSAEGLPSSCFVKEKGLHFDVFFFDPFQHFHILFEKWITKKWTEKKMKKNETNEVDPNSKQLEAELDQPG